MHTPIVDLHVHSTRSDGTFTPTELVDYALEKGLSAFALTDHDTTEGLQEAMEYAKGKPIEIVPGIEFSTEFESKDIHIVGLFINYELKEFKEKVQSFIDSRDLRNQKMCQNLCDIGFSISYEELCKAYPNSTITRSHYARYLLDHGYVKSMAEAFERYIGDHAPCFVPREKVTPEQAIKLILSCDGIPILAHPTLYHFSNQHLERLVSRLKKAGLIGIEGIYSTYTKREERQIQELAKKYNLLISGGSDFHGSNKPKLDLACGYGNLLIPSAILENLKKSRIKLIFSDLDGTLLNNNSYVSKGTMEAIHSLTQKGNKLILTSGRPLYSILDVVKHASLHEKGMLIISNNGALIYDCDKKEPLVEHRISVKDLQYLCEEGRKMGIYVQTYTETEIIAPSETKELEFYTRKIHIPTIFSQDLSKLIPNGSYKAMAIHLEDKSKLEAFKDHILAHCGDRIQAVFSNDKYLELLPIEAGKGNAVRYVCDYFHVPINHSYACGDQENDISMLQAAGTGIAMKNATEPVKKIAAIITENDNDHDGLVPIFQKI